MKDELEITLPKLGESIVEATVVQWFKKEGDPVGLDEALLEVSTDKINSEIPSPAAGVLKKILAGPDKLVKVGEPLAILSAKETAHAHVSSHVPPVKEKIQGESTAFSDFFSPAVLRLAREKGISLDELESVPRSGEGGRLSKKDVEDYALQKSSSKKEICAAPKTTAPCPLQTERVKMTPLRKAIAENMVKSFYEAPHASLVTEVDVTKAVKQIQAEKESFQAKHGVKLSITTFVAKAMTQAIHAFPLINSSLEDDTIVMKRFINLGIAVSVDQGVMVPVIKNAQTMDLPQLAKAISAVATKARQHQLTLEDVQGGSITLTNFGMAGTLIGIPIIRYPEVAIVGLGAIHKKVVVMDDETLSIRSIMNVSLTFDHRVLDGLYGCGFLNELKKHIENL